MDCMVRMGMRSKDESLCKGRGGVSSGVRGVRLRGRDRGRSREEGVGRRE